MLHLAPWEPEAGSILLPFFGLGNISQKNNLVMKIPKESLRSPDEDFSGYKPFQVSIIEVRICSQLMPFLSVQKSVGTSSPLSSQSSSPRREILAAWVEPGMLEKNLVPACIEFPEENPRMKPEEAPLPERPPRKSFSRRRILLQLNLMFFCKPSAKPPENPSPGIASPGRWCRWNFSCDLTSAAVLGLVERKSWRGGRHGRAERLYGAPPSSHLFATFSIGSSFQFSESHISHHFPFGFLGRYTRQIFYSLGMSFIWLL